MIKSTLLFLLSVLTVSSSFAQKSVPQFPAEIENMVGRTGSFYFVHNGKHISKFNDMKVHLVDCAIQKHNGSGRLYIDTAASFSAYTEPGLIKQAKRTEGSFYYELADLPIYSLLQCQEGTVKNYSKTLRVFANGLAFEQKYDCTNGEEHITTQGCLIGDMTLKVTK